jgi:hypothetical protein
VSRGQRNESPTVVNFGFLDRSRYFLEIAEDKNAKIIKEKQTARNRATEGGT